MNKFKNNASTTLTADITNNQTTLSVFSAVGFPTSRSYKILVDYSEIMWVTGGFGTTTWTVSRGGTTDGSAGENTPQAQHSSGSNVTLLVSAYDFNNFRQEYNVVSYGAKADGVTDDTVAIQNAINDVGATGGTVFFPAGTYVFQPQSTVATYALNIPSSNIRFLGEGRGASILKFMVYPLLNPTTNWNLVAGAVLRGYGFNINATVSNIVFEKLEIQGGAGYTGNGAFPADPGTGDGWDITHKAIFTNSAPTFSVDNFHVNDCYIHSWRGEIIYAGGSRFTNWVIQDCELSDTNGDCISISGDCDIFRNKIHLTASNGIENTGGNATTAPITRVYDNRFWDIILDAASFRGVNGGVEPFTQYYIFRNKFLNCSRSAVSIGRTTHNVYIMNNEMTDCGQTTLIFTGAGNSGGSINIVPTADSIDNLHISNNLIICDNSNMNTGIRFVAGSFPIKDVECTDNVAWVTDRAVSNGFAMNSPFIISSGSITGVARWARNYGKGTTFQETDLTQAEDTLLTTTVATTVVQLRPSMLAASANYIVSGYLRVTVGSTTVTVTITYRDVSNATVTLTVLPATSLPVGVYEIAPVAINAIGSNGSAVIKLNVTAGTANQVFASGAIQEAFD